MSRITDRRAGTRYPESGDQKAPPIKVRVASAVAEIARAAVLLLALIALTLGVLGFQLALSWAVESNDRVAIAGFGGLGALALAWCLAHLALDD